MRRYAARRIVTLLLLIGIAPCLAHAQGPGGGDEVSRQLPALGTSGDPQGSPQARAHTSFEIALSVAVLVFGAIVIGLQILVMLRQNKYWDTWAIKIVGLTLVITSGLFLIVAGYSQDQVAPMMGILGTVVGYLLGKDEVPGRTANQGGVSAVP